MKNNPTVAILLCTYNGEKYIEAQLESILNQSYPNVHCYIHDDGSSDRTVSIIKDYECSYPEVFTKLDYQNMSHGAVVNFMSLINYASANCKEDYFMLSDQDDIWLPAKVSDSVKELQKYDQDNKPALVYCDQQVVDENLHVIVRSTNKLVGKSTEDDSFKRIVFRNTAAGCCMCFNKELLSIASKNQDIKNIPMHDWWVMLIAAIYNNAHYFDSTLMLYRQHGDNVIGGTETLAERFKRRWQNFIHPKCLRSMEAEELYKYYYDSMNPENQSIIKQIHNYRQKSFISRLSIAFNPVFRTGSITNDLIFKLAIITKRY